MTLFRYSVATFLTAFFAFQAVPAFAVEPQAPEKLFSRMDAVRIIVRDKLGEKFRKASNLHKKDHGALVQFYAEHDDELLWVDENGLVERAKRVIAEIQKAEVWGLRVRDYDLPAVRRFKTKPSATDLASLELKMGYAVLTYARHASGGRVIPSRLSRNLDHKPPYVDPLSVLDAMSQRDDEAAYLQSLHPRHAQFLQLKKYLAKLRGRTTKVVRRVIIPDGPLLRPGMVHDQIILVRKRLDLDPDGLSGDPRLYDEEVADAVRAFQSSKGLRAEAIIGRLTRRAMNGGKTRGPVSRINRVLANMERWRWMPRELGHFHVRVNVPEFRVRVVKGSKLVFSERIVAGKVINATPVFSDQMEYLVFNPYWNPPRSIVMEEIIPGAQRSASFIQRQGLQVWASNGRRVDPTYVNWNSAGVTSYSFRQPPGKHNVLGVVKFMFPNKHAVYMHDTPSKSLFNKRVRAYSHGCMRVRNPKRMAEVILSEQKNWSPRRISAVIASGANTRVNLARPIPVHVTYFTLQFDNQGKLHAFNDLYGHDSRVINAFAGKYPPRTVLKRPRYKFKKRPKPQQDFWSWFN